MLQHQQEVRTAANEEKFAQRKGVPKQQGANKPDQDGLSSLEYKVLRSEARPLFYHLVVDL